MREILFKARTEFDNTKFVYGSIVKVENIIAIVENEFPCEMKIIDSNTLCQFTGLVDKNEKLIFENDILECGSRSCYGEKITHTFSVVYNAPKFELKVINSDTWKTGSIVMFFEHNSFEVKGNVHD